VKTKRVEQKKVDRVRNEARRRSQQRLDEATKEIRKSYGRLDEEIKDKIDSAARENENTF
jgi:hypothetical protein